MKHKALFVVLAGTLAVAAVAVWKQPTPSPLETQPPEASIRPRIVSFPAKPLVRVNVTPKSGSRFTIAIDGPYTVRSFKSRKTLARRKRLKSTVAAVSGNGIRIGDSKYATTGLEIVSKKSPSIWVGNHQYRGRLRLIRQRGGSLLAVNVVPLEDYVASVVNGETPATFPLESRKAQAIVARSYALYEAAQRRSTPFDVYADARSQVYPGFQYRTRAGRRLAGESGQSRRIAQSTIGLVCTYHGRLFHTYYSAVCGGRTLRGTEVFSDARRPYPGVECRWCRDAKRYRWSVTVARATVANAIQKYFAARNRRFGKVRSIQRNPAISAGRMPRFTVSDGRRRYELTGADLRRRLGASRLPSARFDVHLKGSSVLFRGQGHGHGVGLCQWGAAGLAKAGRDAAEILRYYYRDIRIAKLDTLTNNRAARTAARPSAEPRSSNPR